MVCSLYRYGAIASTRDRDCFMGCIATSREVEVARCRFPWYMYTPDHSHASATSQHNKVNPMKATTRQQEGEVGDAPESRHTPHHQSASRNYLAQFTSTRLPSSQIYTPSLLPYAPITNYPSPSHFPSPSPSATSQYAHHDP